MLRTGKPASPTSPRLFRDRLLRDRKAAPRPSARWSASVLTVVAVGLALSLTHSAGAVFAAGNRDVVHTWKRIYYAPLDGHEALIFLERFERAKPALGDLDGDGDLDLVLGRGDGTLMYFENQGNAKQPDWRLLNESLSARQGPAAGGEAPLAHIDVGDNAAPVLVDIDGDGDLDLFVGAADGQLRQFTNDGNRFLAGFQLTNPDFIGRRFGLNLVAKFPDLNGDGAPDLSLGNEAGEIWIVRNLGTRSAPRFCFDQDTSPECLSIPQLLGRLDPEDNAVPEWVDWDGDKDLDLMVGKSDGTVAFHQNIGDRREGAWELKEARFAILDVGGYAAPVFADLTGDGVADLLLAGDGEQVFYYTRRPKEQRFPLWLESKNVLAIRRLGDHQTRLHLAAGDLDGDGRLDLVVGTRSGQLLAYFNDGTPKAPAFRSPKEPIMDTPHRSYSAPALGDLDGDGDLDLIVGGLEGRLEWIQNIGDATAPAWKIRSLFLGKIDVGSLSAPLLSDLDGDKDLDLLVGNSLGNVALFLNEGSADSPDFVLKHVRFGEMRVAGHAAPALFPWLQGEAPDMVVGSQEGTLLPVMRDPRQPVLDRRGYRAQAQPWLGLAALSHSAPLFADLDGDAAPDLLVGTGAGGLLVWHYGGALDRKALAAKKEHPAGLNIVQGGLPPDAEDESSGLSGPTATELNALTQERGPVALEPIFAYERSALEKLRAGRSTKPAFFDHNGDGRPDLVLGTREGKLLLFLSTGEVGNPTWSQITDAYAGYTHGRNAAPAFYDLDGDGDLDLVVGNEQGRVEYFENTGRGKDGDATFRHRPDALAAVHTRKNAVPAFSDVDGDQSVDLMLGNLQGELQFYRRPATGAAFVLEMRRFIGLDVGVNAMPTFGDLTGGGKQSLLVGSDGGKVRIFEPSGTSPMRSSGWKERQDYVVGLDLPAGARPAVVDIDGDGDPDLVVGSDKGPVRLYRNQARNHEDKAAAR